MANTDVDLLLAFLEQISVFGQKRFPLPEDPTVIMSLNSLLAAPCSDSAYYNCTLSAKSVRGELHITCSRGDPKEGASELAAHIRTHKTMYDAPLDEEHMKPLRSYLNACIQGQTSQLG
jgi:hypothetical protein